MRRRKALREIHFSKFLTSHQETAIKHCLKSYFKKDKLMPSRKPNTHFENHFHHCKVLVWLVIQKHSLKKKKKYNQKPHSINTKIK